MFWDRIVSIFDWNYKIFKSNENFKKICEKVLKILEKFFGISDRINENLRKIWYKFP